MTGGRPTEGEGGELVELTTRKQVEPCSTGRPCVACQTTKPSKTDPSTPAEQTACFEDPTAGPRPVGTRDGSPTTSPLSSKLFGPDRPLRRRSRAGKVASRACWKSDSLSGKSPWRGAARGGGQKEGPSAAEGGWWVLVTSPSTRESQSRARNIRSSDTTDPIL